MPIHEYRDANGVLHDRIYLTGDVIPEAIKTEFGVAHKVISSPSIRFVGAFSGATQAKDMVTNLGDNIAELDDGGRRRMKEIAKEKEAARDKGRADFIAEQLRTYDI